MSQIKAKTPQHIRVSAQDQGYNNQEIDEAWVQCSGDENYFYKILNGLKKTIIDGPAYNSNNTYQQDINNKDDQQYQEAIYLSMQKMRHDTVNAEQRQRIPGVPVGLKNVGNTCYFNCLLQTYFDNIQFVNLILQSNIIEIPQPQKNSSLQEQNLYKKKKLSQEMIKSLQKVFAQMIKSNTKYVDPSEILMNLTDDYGNYIKIGDQNDVGEFNCHFLSRVSDGLDAQKNLKHPPPEFAQSQIMTQSQNSDITFNQFRCDFSLNLSRAQINVSHDTISNLYFGKVKTFLTYMYEDKLKQIENEEDFNFITLNLKSDNLLECWNDYFNDQIQDYRNERGDKVSAQKVSYLTKTPLHLFFQLSRVYYDKNVGKVMKNHQYLNFQKDIHIDKYLLQNKSKYEKLSQNTFNLRVQIDEKKSQLKDLIYHGQDQSENVLQQLQSVINYQQRPIDSQPSQQGSHIMQESGQFGTRKIQSEIIIKPSQNIKVAETSLTKELKKQLKDIQKKKDNLEQDIHNLQKQFDKAHNIQNNQKYQLSSILIHDGQYAESGHYYAYVYDFERSIWRKYDDTNVTEEDEQVVFQKSFGGPGKLSSAYFLMYTAEANTTSKNFKGPIHQYNIKDSKFQDQDLYSTFLKVDQIQYVQKLNKQFEQELFEYQNEQQVAPILKDYNVKYQAVQKMISNVQKIQNGAPSILNPCVFVATQPYQMNQQQKDFFIKFLILESSVNVIHTKKIVLGSLTTGQHDAFLQKLDQSIKRELQNDTSKQIKQGNSSKYPENLVLNKQQAQVFNKIQTDYVTNLGYAASLMYLFEQAYHKNSKFCLIGLDYFAQLVQNEAPNTYFRRILVQLLMYIPAFVLREMETQNFQEQINKQYLELLTAIIIKYYDAMEFQTLKIQIQIWIGDIGEKSKKLSELASGLISNIESQNKNQALMELLNQKIDELNNRTVEMSNKHDLYNWSPGVTDDVFIKCTQNFQEFFDTTINKEVKFVDYVVKTGNIMEKNDREKYFK